MTDSEIFLTKSGKRKGTIKSELLKAYTRLDTTLLYGVEALFFDEEGNHTSTLTADSGRVSQRANTMSVFGNVQAWSVDDRRLIADSLRWDANEDKVMTEGYVEIYRGADMISGYGLEADQRLESAMIKRSLKGEFREPQRNR